MAEDSTGSRFIVHSLAQISTRLWNAEASETFCAARRHALEKSRLRQPVTLEMAEDRLRLLHRGGGSEPSPNRQTRFFPSHGSARSAAQVRGVRARHERTYRS